MALTFRAAFILAFAVAAAQVAAQGATSPAPPAGLTPVTPPAPFKPAEATEDPDVWIFSGILQTSKETYSGTLVSGKKDAQFELKLAGGATCDGTDFNGEVGLVRISEIPCTDGRSMRALFVPQGGKLLKVFGHVGDERFAASAHLLGAEPAPEQKQTMQPTVPQVQPTDGPPPSVRPSPAPTPPDAK